MGIVELVVVVAVVAAIGWWGTRRYLERKVASSTVLDAADPVIAQPLDGPLPDALAAARERMLALGLTPVEARQISMRRLGLELVQVLAVEPEQRWWAEVVGSFRPEDPPPLWAITSLLSGGRAVLTTGTRHRLPLGEAELAQTLPDADPTSMVVAHREALVLLASRGVVPERVPAEHVADAADRAHHLSCQPCRDDPAGTTRRILANQRDDRDEARGRLAQQADLGVRLAHLHAG